MQQSGSATRRCVTTCRQVLRTLTWLRISHTERSVVPFPLHDGRVWSREHVPLGLAAWVWSPGRANSPKWARVDGGVRRLALGVLVREHASGAAAPLATSQNETRSRPHALVASTSNAMPDLWAHGTPDRSPAGKPRARSAKPLPAPLSCR